MLTFLNQHNISYAYRSTLLSFEQTRNNTAFERNGFDSAPQQGQYWQKFPSYPVQSKTEIPLNSKT